MLHYDHETSDIARPSEVLHSIRAFMSALRSIELHGIIYVVLFVCVCVCVFLCVCVCVSLCVCVPMLYLFVFYLCNQGFIKYICSGLEKYLQCLVKK